MDWIFRRALITTAGLVLVFFFAGCGYHNPYISSVSSGPGNHESISMHVPMWTNQTNELGLESIFHQELTRWLQMTSEIRLVSAEENPDFLLKGRLLSIDHPGQSYGKHDEAIELEARVQVCYSLTDARSGKLVWEESKRNLDESYMVDKNWTMTRDNMERALREMADKLAEDIYMRIMYTVVEHDPKREVGSQKSDQ